MDEDIIEVVEEPIIEAPIEIREDLDVEGNEDLRGL